MRTSTVKVVHICTNIVTGGAARATFNLHLGLRQLGIESTVLSLADPKGLPFCESYFNLDSENRAIHSRRDVLLKEVSKLLAWKNRTHISNTHFSIDLFGCDLSRHPLVCEADVINLHWTAEFLSSRSVFGLAALGKPVVWTLHDMRPLTGGCHFSAGCNRFMEACGECPQLAREPADYTARSLKAMSSAIAAARPVFIGPSQWMLQNIRKSSVARNCVSHHIPYGVDSNLFEPLEKAICRSQLNVEKDVWYILVTMYGFREFRKGVENAIAILEQIRRDPVGRRAVATGQMRVLSCGADSDQFRPRGWCVDRYNSIRSDRMPVIYNSANVLLFTSVEDNLPNVILEAIACGVPVISHRVGGASDILNDEPRCLFEIGDVKAAAHFILSLFQKNDSELCSRLVAKVRENYSNEKQAFAYLKLYKDLIAEFQKPQSLLETASSQEGAHAAFSLLWQK
ncbi:MAG: hypothetical protein C5B47_03545 [Verrucomicrobia bacterium]|nr:MAG: hypothetical protein C5B47_03545 [Verrucomicrobiota bacterium]